MKFFAGFVTACVLIIGLELMLEEPEGYTYVEGYSDLDFGGYESYEAPYHSYDPDEPVWTYDARQLPALSVGSKALTSGLRLTSAEMKDRNLRRCHWIITPQL